ncbi:hypothetical protein K2173_005951 [Erythroxylum novogranatense]|uniref:6-phosphogluconolactonase n=1 Tax=Erythroxylum novogranatense TaxID=1862640 RepID=A0AAV8TU40_9ROSI|nr:hypothetical protein K2173_005951 [Erythroxylum novogranatense]
MASSSSTFSSMFSVSLCSLSSSMPKDCRPYGFLVSPPQPNVVPERLINKNSFRLRRACGVVGQDSTSNKRYDSSRTKALMGCAPMGALPKKKVEVFETEEDMAMSLAKYIADLSSKFIKERGLFSIVLSGGTLIQSLRKLVEPPYISSIEWSKWHVFWVDERVVREHHVDSNYRVAFDAFLSRVPILLANVHNINDALSAESAADEYETRIKNLAYKKVVDTSSVTGLPKFDLILLGMGPDGHVASLFPGHPAIWEKQKWVTSITDSPKPPPQRITFTFPLINSSSHVALVVCGAGQSTAVRTALGKSKIADTLPVKMVSPEQQLNWFLDKNAAF